jgi:hypothetical protein
MIIDADAYRINKEPLLQFLRNKEGSSTPFPVLLTEFAVSLGCPLIVVYSYVAESRGGYDEELCTLMRTVIKFYGYTGIKNVQVIVPEHLWSKE